jgi:LysM repeat protein
MAQLPHKARRYGYKLKQRFRQEPFSFAILWALFFSAVLLIFAFRGLIATMFIRPSGVINPNTQVIETSADENSDIEAPSPDSIKLQSTGTYTVQSGDTLYGIAVEIGSTTEALAKANDLEPPYSLSVGQELKLP